MNTNLRLFYHRQNRGFTLIEVLVAVSITAVIMIGITTAIIQMLTINNQNTNMITAQRQLQQVGYALSTDALQATKIIDNNGTGSGHASNTDPFTWPIVLSWTDISGNSHDVTYSLSSAVVTRVEKINSVVNSTKNIATDISSAVFTRTGIGTYRLTVISTIAGSHQVTQTRTYDITARAF